MSDQLRRDVIADAQRRISEITSVAAAEGCVTDEDRRAIDRLWTMLAGSYIAHDATQARQEGFDAAVNLIDITAAQVRRSGRGRVLDGLARTIARSRDDVLHMLAPTESAHPQDNVERLRESDALAAQRLAHNGELGAAAAMMQRERDEAGAEVERLREALNESAGLLREVLNGYKESKAADWLLHNGFRAEEPPVGSLAALAASSTRRGEAS